MFQFMSSTRISYKEYDQKKKKGGMLIGDWDSPYTQQSTLNGRCKA